MARVPYHRRYRPADGYKQGSANLRSDGAWVRRDSRDSFGKGAKPDPIEFEPASRNYTRRLPKVGGILSAMNGVIPIGQLTSYAYLGGPKREGLRPLRQLPLKISVPST
jgi:hypothetical protein